MILGVDYYPEQWPDELLEADLDRIVELGCNTIRIGEFGWHIMEPREGEYDFSYFDKVIEAAKQKGLNIIFGTPTAVPPAWMAKDHPDILAWDEHSVPRNYGGRHVYCFSSEVYRDYCRKIVEQLAKHYRGEEQIIAWQIDNELGHEGSDICFCPRCRDKFQRFLKDKFGDIRDMNARYGTVFWSHTYNDFSEVPVPGPTITTHNPALRLDWERFCSENIVSFAAEQAAILKRILPNAQVMHDFPGGGLDKHVDYSRLAEHLDRVAYNNYPVWGGQKEPLPPWEIAFELDYMRGLRRENFWITEAIMGAQGHDVTGYLPRPGQAAMWSWQAVARGCEGLLYFRYRGATKGAEQFCYGLLDPDNVPCRRFYEAQGFFDQVCKYEDVLVSPLQSSVAMLYDYDSLASLRIQRQSALLDSRSEMKRLHRSFFEAGQPVDVIEAKNDFSGYRVVVVSSMIVTDGDFARRLKDYVAHGGIAVVTWRTAVKDRDNNLVFGKVLPVDLDDLTGVRVEETESVQEEGCIPFTGEISGAGGVFRDMLVAGTARVIARYDDPFYRQYAAVTCNQYGEGTTYYIGTAMDEAATDQLLRQIMKQAGLTVLNLPKGVEGIERASEKRKVRFLINHEASEQTALGQTLAPFEVAVQEI